MITINNREKSHRLYHELQSQRPDLFKDSPAVQYITNEDEIKKYEQESGERIGVLYKMKDYEVFVVDLIKKGGELSIHGRIILPNNGVIIIPKLSDKFILENQYRYPVCDKHLAFPRGHCEPGLDPVQDAIRETQEELGGATLVNPEYIGKTYPETHSDAWYCSVYTGDVQNLDIKGDSLDRGGYEDIESLILLTADEIDAKIRAGEIDCGYTLAAWSLYRASR